MRTTLDIDEKLMAEAVRFTGEKNRSKAVSNVLSEFVRRRKLEELRALIGNMGLTDDWREREEAELAEMKREG